MRNTADGDAANGHWRRSLELQGRNLMNDMGERLTTEISQLRSHMEGQIEAKTDMLVERYQLPRTRERFMELETAVDDAIASGVITGDVTKPGQTASSTVQFGDAVVAALKR